MYIYASKESESIVLKVNNTSFRGVKMGLESTKERKKTLQNKNSIYQSIHNWRTTLTHRNKQKNN